MTAIVRCATYAELCRFEPGAGWPALTATDWTHTPPDAHWQLVDHAERCHARCSTWWSNVAHYPGARLGYIGHFAADDAAAARRLLEKAALPELARHGATLALAPIDGSTWASYRLVTETSGEPAFFLEPQNPLEWPGFLEASGFRRFASYRSLLLQELVSAHPVSPAVEARLAVKVRLRSLCTDDIERDLSAIFRASLVGFAGNFLYSPISQSAFMARYRALLPYVDPRLVWLAEAEERLVGFAVCVPDHLQAARAQPVDTVVVKTLAVVPERRYAGVGSLLWERARRAALASGYRRMVHALMHEDNASRHMSEWHVRGHTIRRYHLFSREIPA